jgi:CheY-like chemotaxis protein
MDGFEVAKRIRRKLELGNVVLVALTGYGQEADQHRSKDAGFYHQLTKTADFGKVKGILATVAERAT